MPVRNLAIVLGDQLDSESAVFDDFDADRDVVWMAEVAEEATYVPAHRRRLVLFFAAMRHFRDSLRREGIRVQYQALSMDAACDRGTDFAEVLREDVPALQPATMVVVEPGDWRVREALRRCADELRVPLEIRRDRHFYCGIDEFRDWARQRRSLLL
ncbi:MAG: cryptochrome/photolyase family protein, partial [Ectothiorhodospiraceae bacterium]